MTSDNFVLPPMCAIKRVMKWSCLLVMAWAMAGVSAAELKWLDNLPKGLKQAHTNDVAVLLNFHGPDEYSQQLQDEVFNQPEFIAFAQSNLVLVQIDFSGAQTLSPEQSRANRLLADEFEVDGWPTTYILDKNGQKLAKAGYVEGGVANYIGLLEKVPGFRVKTASPAAPAAAKAAPAPGKKSAPFVALVPVVGYTEIVLKGVSMGETKTALINNQTFVEGEVANIRVADRRVKIQCLEIRKDTVVIRVENEAGTRELRFRPRALETTN